MTIMLMRTNNPFVGFRACRSFFNLQAPGFKTLLATLLLAFAASAQSAAGMDEHYYSEMSLSELMDLEVFRAASLLPTRQAKAPGTVYSFTRDDFTRLGVRRVEDLLQFVPGIQLNQYRKRHRAVWMRGLLDRYNDKVVLLVDGIRRQHLYYGHFSLGDNLPLERVEKVEIIQGPASSLYGANAFAGIISITTRDFAQEQGLEASLELADNDRAKAAMLYNSPKLQLFGSALVQDAPYREDRKSFIGRDVLQPLDEEYTNFSLKAVPMEGLTLMLDYQKNETPFLFIPNTQDAFIDEQVLNLAASYEAGDLDSGKLEANFHYTKDETLEYEKEQVSRNLGYEERQNAVLAGTTITAFKRLFSDHVFALGFSWQHAEAKEMDYVRYFHFADGWLTPPESGQLLSEPGIVTDDFAFYLQDVWDITPELNLTLGARYDIFDRFDNHLNYRGALIYSPDERQTWKLMYGTAIRTPTQREYLKVMEGTAFVPPVPDPEEISSVELGYRYQWEQASLDITLFDNQVKNYIHEVPTPDGADEYFTNSNDKWNMRGAELLVRYSPTNRLRFRLGAAYLDAEQAGTGDLPYLASWNGSFNANYDYLNDHSIGLSLFYNGKREDTNGYPDDQPDAFLLTNLTAFGKIDKHWSYSLGIDNLFDEKVFDPAGDFGGQHNTERSEREIWLRVRWDLAL